MKQINLRDCYPHYKEDKIVEVPDEVAALLEDLDRKEERTNCKSSLIIRTNILRRSVSLSK